MPNGGSDCCGTCPFNRKNRGETGYAHARDTSSDHCEIRDLAIEVSFWTYCTNHPHHNPQRIPVPVGPVYVCDDGSYLRKVWKPSPDTEEVRAEVLRLIEAATPESIVDYPAGFALAEAAILQAGEFRDPRYIPALERIRRFPGTGSGNQAGVARDPARSAAFAERSLARILPPAEILPFASDTARQVAATTDQSGDAAGLAVLADALQEAGCAHVPTLESLRNPEAHAAGGPWWVVDVILGRVDAQPG